MIGIDVVADVAARLRDAAHTVAAQIDALDGCTPEQRADMRGLPMMMLEQAERLHPTCADAVEAIVRRYR